MGKSLIAVLGWCEDCDFTAEAKNGQGLMAQHHYRTGHEVHTELTYHWSMGDSEPDESTDE